MATLTPVGTKRPHEDMARTPPMREAKIPKALPKYGLNEWKELGANITGIIPALPENLVETLKLPCACGHKTLAEHSVFVLVPGELDNEYFTLKKLIAFAKEHFETAITCRAMKRLPDQAKKENETHWILMSRCLLPNSRESGYRYKPPKISPPFAYPTPIEAALCMALFSSSAPGFFKREPSYTTLTRCEDGRKKKTAVGGFDPKWQTVQVQTAQAEHANYGIAPVVRF